jgi:hypothetical protein
MIDMQDLRKLLASTETAVLSLYLHTDPAAQENQAATPAWSIDLKNALKEVEKTVAADQLPRWQAIRERVEGFFEDYTPKGKGLALFYNSDLNLIYELPVPLKNHASFGKPDVAPLVRVIDEYEPYLIVMIDREKAGLLAAYLGSVEYQEQMTAELHMSDWHEMKLASSPASVGYTKSGHSRDRFAARVDEQIEHFYRDVARRASDLREKYHAERVILVGSMEAAHALKESMSGENVIDIVPVPMWLSPGEVLAKVLPLALDYERQQESTLLDSVINLAKSGGRGALGYDDVIDAFTKQAVELFIVPGDSRANEEVDNLTARAVELGAKVEFVHGEAAERLKREGGLAARLYYPA